MLHFTTSFWKYKYKHVILYLSVTYTYIRSANNMSISIYFTSNLVSCKSEIRTRGTLNFLYRMRA